MKFIVSILLDDGQNSEQRTYIFDNRSEAEQFAAHMRDLYGYMDTIIQEVNGVDTYDSAIQDVVESIGPSPEKDQA